MLQTRIVERDWRVATDAELVDASLDRSAGAFAALMERYNRKLYRAARAITANDAEAEDVVQEAWTRAFTQLAGFRREARLSTWLVRIAVNEALGRRRAQRVSVPIDAVDEVVLYSIIPLQERPLDQEGDVFRSQIRRVLEKAIDGLPDDFRVVFVMRAVEDLDVDEVAGLLGIAPATVRSRMFRARALLREHLDRALYPRLTDVFPFAGARCRCITRRVLAAVKLEVD